MKRLLGSILLTLVASSPIAAQEGVAFIEDNFAKAVAEARTRKVPIFVEAWAPW